VGTLSIGRNYVIGLILSQAKEKPSQNGARALRGGRLFQDWTLNLRKSIVGSIQRNSKNLNFFASCPPPIL